MVFINDFDIDRYVTLDEHEKKSLKLLLLDIVVKHHLVNVVDLVSFLKIHGEEYGIQNLNDANEIISANPGAFRLWFEGNYQCGYRTSYAQTIDLETGEVRKGKR